MTAIRTCFRFTSMLLAGLLCSGADFYVDASRPDDSGDGTSWATAKKTIQAAIDQTSDSDTVWVTNGTYNTGNSTFGGSALTNRVTISNAITLCSMNGPAYTSITGAKDHDMPGPNAIRGVYLNTNSSLIGFTVANGAVLSGTVDQVDHIGGGILCDNAIVSNCWVITNSAVCGGGGVGVPSGMDGYAYNCRFLHNRAGFQNNNGLGGAIYRGTVYSSVLISNSAYASGGGASHISGIYDSQVSYNYAYGRGGGIRLWATASNCVITYNTCSGGGREGGGVNSGTLRNCFIAHNVGGRGAAMHSATAYNCNIVSNTSDWDGGGARNSTLYDCTVIGNFGGNQAAGGLFGCTAYNCLIVGNETSGKGGGAKDSTLNNCTVAYNYSSSADGGGGLWHCFCTNSIVYSNEAAIGADYAGTSTFYYSCSTPLPAGTGNIDSDPVFIQSGTGYGTNHVAGDYELRYRSYCVDGGADMDANTNDINGVMRPIDGKGDGSPKWDIGAYEYVPPPSGSIFSLR